MPVIPYPISGHVYDTDASTAVQGAHVSVYNSRTHESFLGQGTTNASGEYTVDLANLPSGYADGDVVYLLTWYGRKSVEYRITVDTSIGSSEQDMTLHFQDYFPGDQVRLQAYSISNQHASALRVDLYQREDDTVIISVNVPTADTKTAHFGRRGIVFKGGIAIIPSDYTKNRLSIALKSDDTM